MYGYWTKNCPHCKEDFGSFKNDQIYCSGKCKQAAYRARRGATPAGAVMLTCSICADRYEGHQKRKGAAQYCSNKCKQKAYRQRRNESKRQYGPPTKGA